MSLTLSATTRGHNKNCLNRSVTKMYVRSISLYV